MVKLRLTFFLSSITCVVTISQNNFVRTENEQTKADNTLVERWAPRIWFAPNEQFFPLSVPEFLQNVQLNRLNDPDAEYYLGPKEKTEQLLLDPKSFLYGRNPKNNSVPIYAIIKHCLQPNDPNSSNNIISYSKDHFHITYWFFYPYNKGKEICTMQTKRMGPIPIPLFFQTCLGEYHEYGNHIGDWEHMRLFFNGKPYPEYLYLSTHDSGGYYVYDQSQNTFKFVTQDLQKEGLKEMLFEKANFPKYVTLGKNGHPELFAANGSHGLWSAAGRHLFTRIARLYDDTGYGTKWETWKNVKIIEKSDLEYSWMKYKGRWGNVKEGCHPIARYGIYMCKYSDGPLGIPHRNDNLFC